jgi:hypothetical protein
MALRCWKSLGLRPEIVQGAIGNDGFIQSQREITVSEDYEKITAMR